MNMARAATVWARSGCLAYGWRCGSSRAAGGIAPSQVGGRRRSRAVPDPEADQHEDPDADEQPDEALAHRADAAEADAAAVDGVLDHLMDVGG